MLVPEPRCSQVSVNIPKYYRTGQSQPGAVSTTYSNYHQYVNRLSCHVIVNYYSTLGLI